MTTPEHPATPALTRKQIRELRNTGSTPVITATPNAEEAPQDPTPTDDAPTADGAPEAPAAPASAPLPRPSDPAPVAPAPVPDSSVDLGVSPLTRRQARQQERIRTASVPVITPEVVAAHAAAGGGASAPFVFPAGPPPVASLDEAAPSLFAPPQEDSAVPADSGMHALFGIQGEERTDSAPVPSWQDEAITPTVQPKTEDVSDPDEGESSNEGATDSSDPDVEAPKAVNPLLGASLLDDPPAGQPAAVEFPPSFDQLLSRTTGATAIPSALIMSQAPEVGPLVAPVTATGEVIVTGTFNLPEGLGSTGHVLGTADGKEIDATLIDGELPSHSSPTPIAASAAVSTVKSPGEVIKPPAPEKGGKLMMSLAITAGVLALALVGVLILAFVTGVF